MSGTDHANNGHNYDNVSASATEPILNEKKKQKNN